MLWGLCHGVCKLRCPKEGGPICRVDLDWKSKLEHRGPKTQQKNYTDVSFLDVQSLFIYCAGYHGRKSAVW